MRSIAPAAPAGIVRAKASPGVASPLRTNRTVPNPARKPAYQQIEKARRALHSAETARDRELLAASTPPPGTTIALTNTMIDTINAGSRPRQEQTAVDTTSNPHLLTD